VKNESRRLKAVYCEGSVCETVAADHISNEQLLELDVELLIPCALENVIAAENADRISAPVIVEGANGPVTSQADEILFANGKLVVPDILANAGGVTVSYFEWVQNRGGYYWREDEVHAKLHAIVAREFGAVHSLMRETKTDMRTAAYALALGRIGEAVEAQGTQRYFARERER
jgi:glutamate dehydrogenase (NADP+)